MAVQFGGDPAVIGKDLRIDGQPFSVIGVMPKGFYFLNPEVMLWRPLAFTAQEKSDERRHSNNFQNLGRLKPGATVERAQQQVDALNARNLERFPAMKPLLINAASTPSSSRCRRRWCATSRRRSTDVGRCAVVLLIGCVNVANLVLVRSGCGSRARDEARARRGKVARRAATGHGERHPHADFRGGGLAVAYGALRLLGTINIQDLPRGGEIRLDGVVVAYTVGVAAVIGLVLV